MSERRRHPRTRVAWPVRLWIDGDAIVGRAEDASTHGICLAIAPVAAMQLGRSYWVDLLIDEHGPFSVAAEVRHVGNRRVGVETRRPVPLGAALRSTA